MDVDLAPHDNPLVISYLDLRKAIGLLGLALPFALLFGGLIFDGRIEQSISAFYYTPMRNVLVGTLCAIGVFLSSYRGYDRRDAIAGILGCVFAVGVAMCPEAPTHATPRQVVVGYVHYTFAAALFLTLAYFSLRLFTLSSKPRQTPQKLARNSVYRVCGWTILGAMALILVRAALFADRFTQYDPVFWLESLSVWAFGVSWGVKGEAILKDQR